MPRPSILNIHSAHRFSVSQQKMAKDQVKEHHDIATRAMVLTLKSPLTPLSTLDTAKKTGVPKPTIHNIYKRALERGYDPNAVPFLIKDDYLKRSPGSGRTPGAKDSKPRVRTPSKKGVKNTEKSKQPKTTEQRSQPEAPTEQRPPTGEVSLAPLISYMNHDPQRDPPEPTLPVPDINQETQRNPGASSFWPFLNPPRF